VSLYAVPYTAQGARQQLADNEIDLCIGAPADMGSEIRTEPLFSENWVCAMKRDHPLARGKLTRDAFLKADHLLVSLSGNPVGVADAALESLGKRRRVAMTLNNFGGVPSLLLSSNLICVLPEGAIRTHALKNKIHAGPVPLPIAPFQCRMAWHVRHHRAQAHDWMRALVAQMCTKVWA
jgi:DNA-binding transcriptional LysR family regulator